LIFDNLVDLLLIVVPHNAEPRTLVFEVRADGEVKFEVHGSVRR